MTVPVEEMYMDRIREKLYCSKLPSGLEVFILPKRNTRNSSPYMQQTSARWT